MSYQMGEPFDRLLSQISHVSRYTGTLLQVLSDQCGAEIAYYAAFVIVCFEASLQSLPSQTPRSYTAEDFQDFTFFEKAQGNQRALALFDDILRVYQADRQNA